MREYINFDWSIMKLSRREHTKNHIATYFCGFFHSLIAITMMRKVLKRTYRGIPKIGSVIVKGSVANKVFQRVLFRDENVQLSANHESKAEL